MPKFPYVYSYAYAMPLPLRILSINNIYVLNNGPYFVYECMMKHILILDFVNHLALQDT